MVLLNGFAKKAHKTPDNEFKTAPNRLKKLKERDMAQHIGGNFDDFLKEEGMHEEVTAEAVKRVIASHELAEPVREGWAGAAKRLAAKAGDALVMGGFGNQADSELS